MRLSQKTKKAEFFTRGFNNYSLCQTEKLFLLGWHLFLQNHKIKTVLLLKFVITEWKCWFSHRRCSSPSQPTPSHPAAELSSRLQNSDGTDQLRATEALLYGQPPPALTCLVAYFHSSLDNLEENPKSQREMLHNSNHPEKTCHLLDSFFPALFLFLSTSFHLWWVHSKFCLSCYVTSGSSLVSAHLYAQVCQAVYSQDPTVSSHRCFLFLALGFCALNSWFSTKTQGRNI